jgi:hypothetical protein
MATVNVVTDAAITASLNVLAARIVGKVDGVAPVAIYIQFRQ